MARPFRFGVNLLTPAPEHHDVLRVLKEVRGG